MYVIKQLRITQQDDLTQIPAAFLFLFSLEVASQFNLPQLFQFHDTLFKVHL